MEFIHEGLAVQLLKRFSGQVKNKEDREDLLQDIRIMICAAEKTYDSKKSKFTTYCNVTVYRDLLNIFDKKKRKFIRGLNYATTVKITSSNSLFYSGIMHDINKLSKDHKRLLKLKLIHGQYKEIARVEKVSPQAIRDRFMVLRRVMNDYGYNG